MFRRKASWVLYIRDMIVFRCDKKYQMLPVLKEKQYQVAFLCKNNQSTILHHLTGKAKTPIFPK